jgi:hypothetical protein
LLLAHWLLSLQKDPSNRLPARALGIDDPTLGGNTPALATVEKKAIPIIVNHNFFIAISFRN